MNSSQNWCKVRVQCLKSGAIVLNKIENCKKLKTPPKPVTGQILPFQIIVGLPTHFKF